MALMQDIESKLVDTYTHLLNVPMQDWTNSLSWPEFLLYMYQYYSKLRVAIGNRSMHVAVCVIRFIINIIGLFN